MNATIIPINTSKQYEVYVGFDLMEEAGELISQVHKPCKVCLVSDTNVAPIYMDKVEHSLRAAGFQTCNFIFEAGEEHKNLRTYASLMEHLAEEHLTRSDILVALGGGVTGDLTGFAAATYNRGMEYVQMPTSILAAVDSSVGGKTAVDLEGGKNLVGAFKQPLRVICDLNTVGTLPSEFRTDGMGEVVKYVCLRDQGLKGVIETGLYRTRPKQLGLTDAERHDIMKNIITKCIQIKADIVANDEFDTGERLLLNLGHTVGHGIERCSDFAITHGYAVATGIAITARAGLAMGITKPEFVKSLESMLESNGFSIHTSFTAKELAAFALNDKKRRGDTIRLVIPVDFGDCILKEIPVSELEAFIAKGL